MTITDDYNFGTAATILDNITTDEAKDYFESNQADEYLSSMEFHDSKLVQ